MKRRARGLFEFPEDMTDNEKILKEALESTLMILSNLTWDIENLARFDLSHLRADLQEQINKLGSVA